MTHNAKNLDIKRIKLHGKHLEFAIICVVQMFESVVESQNVHEWEGLCELARIVLQLEPHGVDQRNPERASCSPGRYASCLGTVTSSCF